MPPLRLCLIACLLALAAGPRPGVSGAGPDDSRRHFRPMDVFELEWASDPRISPDGQRVAYVRNSMDVMTDRRRSEIWVVDSDGGDHRPLTSGGEGDQSSPRWSPDGTRLLYVSSQEGSSQLHLRFMDSGQTARLTRLTQPPRGIVWSRDGRRIAFSMRVPAKRPPLAEMPSAPEGAEWAEPPKVIDKLIYRADGAGYLPDGYTQLFVLPAEGGTPRQVTSGDFNHGSAPAWSADGRRLVFSANRHDDWEYEPRDSEIYEVDLDSLEIRALTDRPGPDAAPVVSADGEWIAYLGYDDRYQGYQLTRLYAMKADGSGRRLLTGALDRSVRSPVWSAEGDGLFFVYDDRGNGKIGFVSTAGQVVEVAGDVGGLSLGRPYASGSLTVAADGRFAYTHTRPDHPADVAVGRVDSPARRITRLNDDLLAHKQLAAIEELWCESSHDGRPIQAWIARPPGFDGKREYPMILEIHGGPFANYGDRFAAEVQLYAAAGYVVLYVNPRGSTSYGEEFGNLIHHAYPGYDYDDLMSAVDAAIARGGIDDQQLFVTGGSGGGVLTAWIVGKTDRFRAAVAAKPVVNWYSFVLTADFYNTFSKYWFPAPPWEDPEAYLKRSPLSLVGRVTTPTMLLTGEEDYRTPMSESEQFYQALKLRRVDAALVRIPGASHGIARRPSQLIAKVAHILAWFERYRAASPAAAE